MVVVVGTGSSVTLETIEIVEVSGSEEICGFFLDPVEIRVKLKTKTTKATKVIKTIRHRILEDEDHL